MNRSDIETDSNEPEAINKEKTGSNYIVGIGSSAGGLEALSSLISALPSDLGITYVVIQHLSPTHRSMLVQLLGRETAMTVCEVQDNIQLEPDVIYIAPARTNTIIQNGRLRLLETRQESTPKPSVNTFFASLAMEKNEDAIGVILSGTGSDGTVGLREIKANGGFTFAQDLNTAKYNGMPQSAITSGCVDWVLPPEKIALEIVNIIRIGPTLLASPDQQVPPHSLANQLKKLLFNVKNKTKINFSGYKEATIWRRIERRMAANHFADFDEYLTYTDTNPDELDKLSKDILISVTSFFRDPESFLQLKKIIKAIVKNKQFGDEIRIWVSACATGEEAYSLAILLAEELGDNLPNFKIQIFATDIDNDAMNIARKGAYLESAFTEMDPVLTSSYFTNIQGKFEISRTLRDMVIFARQDLVQDPPFLRLDLVSCRNVLIYLQSELQSKVLATFHYGLMDGGYLFLGKSESVYQQDNLFDVIDKPHRIYRRRSFSGKIPVSALQLPLDNFLPKETVKQSNAEHRLMETAVRAYVPSSILVNRSLDIQHIYGDVSDFLKISSGKPSTNLMQLLRRELRPDLQLLQHQIAKSMDTVFGRTRTIKNDQEQRGIRLVAHPSEKGVTTAYYLICFEEVVLKPEIPAQDRQQLDSSDLQLNFNELEDELIMTRERLQTVIEELETSNEELQALNEEVQSANEELQSSNEEMEATNEELQSTNEELTTVNEELQIRSTELAETLIDLENVQNSAGFPILAVSEQMTILRYNTPAAALFMLTPISIGNHISSLRLPSGMQSFMDSITEALSSAKALEVATSSLDRHYVLHISPYESALSNVRGAIVTFVDDTERRAIEVEVTSSRGKLLSIMDNSTAVITLKDIAGRYEFVNRQFEQIFNISSKDIIGKTDSQILSKPIADDFRAKELEVLHKLKTIESEDHIQYGNLDLYMLSIRFPLIGTDHLPYGICTQSSDITARVQAESQLRLAARVFDRSSEAIVVTDPKKRILTVNEAFTIITGYTSEEVIGKTPAFLTSGLQDKAFYEAMWSNILTQGWWQGEILNRRKGGDLYPEWLTINAIQDHTGKIGNYVAIFSDITIVKESQQRIEFLATHDPLTELPNRLLFLDRVRQAIARGDRGAYLFAVLFIDLDDFKVVNDSLGHAAGDTILKQVAKLMRGMVRAVDTVARFGGDEFALLIENTSVGEIENTARRLCAAIGRATYLGDQMTHVGASIGIAVFPDDSKDADILLKHADTAMYEAKAKGKGFYQFFTTRMMEQADNRLRMENGLRSALERNQLVLYYQPQIELETQQLIGIEALVRWLDPEQGFISPALFVPMAEKCGLIEKLGEWVTNAACCQMVAWRDQGYNLPHLSINVSIEQLKRGGVLAMMRRLLALYNLPAESIVLEITESSLAEDNENIMEVLQSLKALGLKISIDDFGTGYSSLARLKSYPIDELKIDRSFVDEITEQGHDRIIAQTIIAMSKTLGFTVIAEGVETDAQLETLRSLDCDIVQGFFISKPLPAEDIVKWFNVQTKEPA